MELTYYGANCVRIVTKKAAITIDDNLSEVGLKSITKPGDIALFTGAHKDPIADVKLFIDLPGEYEVSDTSIQGIAARAHLDESGQAATIFKVIGDDIRVVALGHIYPELNDSQLEAIGIVDVLIIPVGGNGYTLDAIGAAKIIKKIEPKLIIPTHYDDNAVKYEVPQSPLDEVIKVLAIEPKEAEAKIKLKSGELGEITQLQILERQ
ncbi:MBL fold metallo-hydrolase [Candidatus Saccharibacteria bacterium]|nr:MBL fold metallo-hydrolase [Candidatus Saccharibacteria bacterium]